MSMKNKIILAIAILLILSGSSVFIYSYFSNKQFESEVNLEMDNFLNSLKDNIQNVEIPKEDSDEEDNTDGLFNTDYQVGNKIIGIMEIESINVRAPIAMGTDPTTLNKYIGAYSTLNFIGEEGTNSAFASHTTMYDLNNCPYCYFQEAHTLKDGDIIKITWKDGHTYTYSVFNKILNESPNKDYYYMPVDGKTIITLTTCTIGNANTRTIIQAELLFVE